MVRFRHHSSNSTQGSSIVLKTRYAFCSCLVSAVSSNCWTCRFATFWSAWASSNWKKTDGETFMALASSIINLNDGCFSPRSILPRCLASVLAFSASCPKASL